MIATNGRNTDSFTASPGALSQMQIFLDAKNQPAKTMPEMQNLQMECKVTE